MNKEVKAVVETDSSGNNVAEERIYFYGYNLSKSTESIYESKHKLGYVTYGEIYDQYYMGYKLDERSFLITSSLDKNIILGFDTLDTKNVTEE